jgi:acetolactate synthase-1/2/3 large subunit
MRANGAQRVAETLRAHGVVAVFTLCGDHTNPLLDALVDQRIRIVDARDERGAAWMAAGWALATGTPGVVVVSNTPALLNAATALADANACGIPVVCITGAPGTDERGRGHPGDADQVEIARPWSKHAVRATHADDAARTVALAWQAASSGRPGVAVVELPMDVQHHAAESPAAGPLGADRAWPPNDVLAKARTTLAGAQRPVIVAGSGVFWSGAGDELRAFAESARIPVFTVRAARGLLSDDHELCLGFPNLMSEAAQIAFGQADVALVLGCELDLLVGNGSFHPGCAMIRVDPSPEAFASGRRAEIEVHGDVRLFLEAVKVERLQTDAWVRTLREAVARRAATVAARANLGGTPLHPGRLVAEIAHKLPGDAMVCVDAGELALWCLDAIPARTPSSLHLSSQSQLGALGMGLPMAIGMKVARPDRPALVIAGDGSFGFTALELETAVRHGVAVGVVVGNDAGWGIVRHLQQDVHGRATAADLPRAPFELIAEFAGAAGGPVGTPKELEIAVTNALAAKHPTLVNAHIDPNVRHEAIPLIAAMFAARANA